MGEMARKQKTVFPPYIIKAFVLFLFIFSALQLLDVPFMYLRLSFILFFTAFMAILSLALPAIPTAAPTLLAVRDRHHLNASSIHGHTSNHDNKHNNNTGVQQNPDHQDTASGQDNDHATVTGTGRHRNHPQIGTATGAFRHHETSSASHRDAKGNGDNGDDGGEHGDKGQDRDGDDGGDQDGGRGHNRNGDQLGSKGHDDGDDNGGNSGDGDRQAKHRHQDTAQASASGQGHHSDKDSDNQHHKQDSSPTITDFHPQQTSPPGRDDKGHGDDGRQKKDKSSSGKNDNAILTGLFHGE